MPRTKLLNGSVPVTFRLPRQVRKTLIAKARCKKLSISELIRRALHREMNSARTKNVGK
jgi:hypothetical protein